MMRRLRGAAICCSSVWLFVDSVGRYLAGISEHELGASWWLVAGFGLVMVLQAALVIQAFAGVRLVRVRA